MTHDLLAQYRRPGAQPVAPPEPGQEPDGRCQGQAGHRAFGVASVVARPIRLELRHKDGKAIARPYGLITEIAYDRATYSGFLLLFGQKLVSVKGTGLRPVVEALLAGTCTYLEELPDGGQPEHGEPVIESITTAPGATPPPAKPAANTGA